MAVGDEVLDLKVENHKTFEFLFKKYYVFLCYEARSYITEEYIIEEISVMYSAGYGKAERHWLLPLLSELI